MDILKINGDDDDDDDDEANEQPLVTLPFKTTVVFPWEFGVMFSQSINQFYYIYILFEQKGP